MTMPAIHDIEIAQSTLEIFGEDNIAAAFLTGGVTSGHDNGISDIDILICHYDEPSEARRAEFTDYYLDLHEQTGRVPDVISPGEVMSDQQMRHGLATMEAREPSLVIPDRLEFDYICWAGMLVSRKRLLTPRTTELNEYESLARNVVDAWVRTLFASATTTDGTGNRTDKDKLLGQTLSCPGYYEPHE